MDEILSVKTLPEPLYRRFRSDRVRVHEENGVVTLTPVQDLQKDALEGKPHLKFVGALSQASYDEINAALVDTQRVDIDEW